MLRVFVVDEKEDLDTLLLEIKRKNVACYLWDGDVLGSSNAGEMLFLVHASKLTLGQFNKLEKAAENGATVVKYTHGNSETREEQKGSGRMLYMHREVLLEVLARAPDQFDLNAFLTAFHLTTQAIEKRGLLNALALLSWCAAHKFDSEGLRRRQSEWISRDKWHQVFSGVTRRDFVKACGKTSELELSTPLRAFVAWMWPGDNQGTGQPPEFGEVLEELETNFGQKVQL